MSDATAKPQGAKTVTLMIRVLLFGTLLLALIVAMRWRGLKSEYERGVQLLEQDKFQEAETVLKGVVERPLSAFKIREPARRAIGLCKAGLATEIANKERSLEGYMKALDLLEQAKREIGPTEELQRRINEYTGYIEKARAAEKANPTTE